MANSYIIIGTGAAGFSAAETIRNADPKASLSIFGDDPHGFYSRPGVAYYLTGEASERQLSLTQSKNFQFINARVTGLQPQAHVVLTADGRSYKYDKLLLATGSSASKLTIPGAELPGVVKLDNLEDAKDILKIARKNRTAVVVGGGIIALEIVEGLLSRGMKVHYLLRSDRYWPNVLDKAESDIVESRLKSEGVVLHYGSEIAQIRGDNRKIKGVDTKSGEQIDCNLVAVAIGIQPRMELARAAGLKTDRGVLTDEYLRTSAPDIFAAGDTAQVLDPASGKASLDALWGTAVAQGRIAGKNMTEDNPTPFNKAVACNVTRLAGVTTTIIGTVGQEAKDADLLTISRGDSESWRQIPNVMAVQWDYDVNHIRIMAASNTFKGAVVMGDQTLSRPLRELISRQADISDILPLLQEPGTPLADTIIDFWVSWSRKP